MRMRTSRELIGCNRQSAVSARAGVTLTEALVAIFVCSLGLMALMTLFPLGAMNMAQAIKDDRAAHSAANATAILRALWRASLQTGGADSGNPEADDAGLTDPSLGLEPLLHRGPVYIDPIGSNSYFGTSKTSLAGIPRWSFPGVTYPQAVRWCSLLDDIVFAPDGTARMTTGEIMREGRWSWAWMVRSAQAGQAAPSPLAPGQPPPAWMRSIEFSVVVYKNRPLSQSAALLPTGERTLPVNFTLNPQDVSDPNNYVMLVSGQAPVKKNQWIVDLTPRESSAGAGSTLAGYFYRVTRVDVRGGQTQLTVASSLLRGGRPVGQPMFAVMDDVAEVFEKLTLE